MNALGCRELCDGYGVVTRPRVQEGHRGLPRRAHVEFDEVADQKAKAVALEAQAGLVVVDGEHDVSEPERAGLEAAEAAASARRAEGVLGLD